MKTSTYKAVIIDDEEDGRHIIALLLQQLFPHILVVGQADSVDTAVVLIHTQNPDIIFLDVELQDGTGFDVLTAAGNLAAQVIMVTAYDHYALKAIKASVLDFILKPVNKEELKDAVHKALIQHHENQEQHRDMAGIADLLARFQNRMMIRKIRIPTIHGFSLADIDKIIRCEASNNYTTLHFSDQAPVIVSRTLAEFEAELKDYGFVRIHHKHLINAGQISEYLKGKGGGGYVVMRDRVQLEVSVRKKEILTRLFDNHRPAS